MSRSNDGGNTDKTCGNPGTNVDRPLFVPGLPHTLPRRPLSRSNETARADSIIVILLLAESVQTKVYSYYLAVQKIRPHGKTSLNQLVAILTRSNLLVSNDSGAMHVMAALQRPQVALFGSSTPRWTAPLNPKAEVFYLGLECSPCFKRQCSFEHFNCLTQISVGQVAEKALEMLKELSES